MKLSEAVMAGEHDARFKHKLGTSNRFLAMEIEKLEQALEEIREVWAGSEGFVVSTCPEAHLQWLLKQTYRIAVDALEG